MLISLLNCFRISSPFGCESSKSMYQCVPQLSTDSWHLEMASGVCGGGCASLHRCKLCIFKCWLFLKERSGSFEIRDKVCTFLKGETDFKHRAYTGTLERPGKPHWLLCLVFPTVLNFCGCGVQRTSAQTNYLSSSFFIWPVHTLAWKCHIAFSYSLVTD